jgi:thymidylate kinase
MEGADASFHARVALAYDRIAEEEPSRILRLNGQMPIKDLSDEVWADFQKVVRQV